MEVVLLEEAGLPDGRLDERLGRRLAVLLEQPLVEAAGVDADPDARPGGLGALGDLGDLIVELADVARVDPDGRAAGVDRGIHIFGLEVDVGDDRDVGVLGDLGEGVGVVLARAGNAHDVAAGSGELGDLLKSGVDIAGERRGHRLDADGAVAAHPNGADLDLARLAAGGQHGGRQGRHTKSNTHVPSIPHVAHPFCRRGGQPPSLIGLTTSA